MKKFSCLFFALMLLILPACGQNSNFESTEMDNRVSIQYSYVEDFTSMEDIMRYSTNIVKANLTSIEDFDGAICVYCFDINEDYTGNTPDEIHMYDAYNSAYIVGHTYYLFLCQNESALYPHTIYTTVVKELIIDDNADSTAVVSVNEHDISVTPRNISERIENSIMSGVIGEYAEELISVSDSANMESVSASADIIVEISVSSEMNANIYASTYAIEVISILKGSGASVPSALSLPPNLDPSKTYYIFLKETPGGSGMYSLFSRVYPAIDTASAIAEDLLMN